MSSFDGNWIEMPGQGPIDDEAIEVALAASGEPAGELALFVSSVRNAVVTPPAPSTAMAAVLAAGFSTDKGDLPATAASNVHGPAQQVSGLPKWRQAKMKIQGFLAGLGVAGKIALGVGVAAAATGGAGATGMLPFSLSGSGHQSHHATTFVPTTPGPTTTVASPGGGQSPPSGLPATSPPKHHGTTPTTTQADPTATTEPPPTPTTQPAPTPTTQPAPTPTTQPAPTPTTQPAPTPTTQPAPPATTPPTSPPTTSAPPGGITISLSCNITGPAQVTCTWTPAANPVATYQLWRWSSAADYAPITGNLTNTFTFVDNTPAPGTTYTYRVFTKRSDGSSGDVSNRVKVTCCS